MKVICLSLILLGFFSVLRAAEGLAEVVTQLKDPSLESAKKVLADLDDLVENGDARTVTLGKKVHRSVKRIFTKEHKMLAGQKAAGEREARARQLDRNGREWLKPNVHGDVNKGAAAVAFRKARALRQDTVDARANLSKEWAEEAADFEKMLGDLEFSKEDESLLVLAELLQAVVKRTPWVKKPSLKYDESRTKFLRHRAQNKDRWITLAKHASDAGNHELSYEFYRQAGMDLGRFRVGASLASEMLANGKPGSAINRFERIGELKKATALKKQHPVLNAESFQKFNGAELARFVAPACIRILIPGGHRSGFFFQQGGFILTCRDGLLDKEGNPLALTVVLEDGRRFPATMVASSQGHDISVLKIKHAGHELLPLGQRVDLKTGTVVHLSGFPDASKNVSTLTKGIIMNGIENYNQQPTSRLALDGSKGQAGAPVIDDRGRVLGVFITSRTGTARSLEIGSILAFLKQL